MLLGVALASCSANLHSDEHYQSEFARWQATYGSQSPEWARMQRGGSAEQYMARLQAFKDNCDKIELHNGEEWQTYKLGHNQFSLLTPDEFADQILDRSHVRHWNEARSRISADRAFHEFNDKTDELEPDIDWVALGAGEYLPLCI